MSEHDEQLLIAAVAMIERMGGQEFQLRYCDEETPTVWIACARWADHWEAAGAVGPSLAVFRLLESVMDGGTCVHCGKPTAVDYAPADELIAMTETMVCWYRFDPELRTFRRQCEGVTT